jgi:hypothetical protein
MIIKAFYGDDLAAVRLPDETRVISAPPTLPALPDYEASVRKALLEPLGCPALSKIVKPDSRVTIAFDDLCLPLPPMARDLRGRAMGVVLEELFGAGVSRDRIKLVCANGLHRKWTLKELRHILGRKVFSEMGPERITNHDAEDPEGVCELGKSEEGRVVEVNRLVRDSDLVVYVNINWTAMNGGWKSVLVGLGTFRSIREHHNSAVLEQGTVMDPERSMFHEIMMDMGKVVSRNANFFTVETVINNRIWTGLAERFLSLEGGRSAGGVPGIARLAYPIPAGAKHFMAGFLRSFFEPVAVHAGRVEQVHPKTLEALARQMNVEVKGQTDALFLALPNVSPYSSFSRINPILTMNMALGYVYNMYQGMPVVRPGGVMIVLNPFLPGFHSRHHPSYIEFWERVLLETKAPKEIEERFEMDFARRPDYIRRYRDDFAYHGVHPLYAWSWGTLALKNLSRVIVVGALNRDIIERMGLENAASVDDALAMAGDTLGRGFSITHPVMPPIFCSVVRE